MNMKHGMIAGFVISAGVITYFDVKNCHDLPWPPRIVATGLVFGLLDLFSILNEELAGIMAIGIVIAAIVNKGFTADCTHPEATVQPASFQALQGNQPEVLA